MKNLTDQVSLVTGAASGIGRATSIELARAGSHLVLADLNEEGLRKVSREIEELGRKAIPVVADLSKKADVSRLAKTAIAELGQVDVLYNNAGVGVGALAQDMTLVDWEWIVNINLWGPVRLTHAILPHMIERGRGHIVTTASMAGLIGVPGLAAYSLTKFAMVGFSEALRVEVADQGIDVSVVCPAMVRTNIVASSRYQNVDNATARKGFDIVPPRYVMEPAEAGKEIVKGIRNREGYILVAPGAKLGWAIKRLAPELAFQINRWVFRRNRGLFGVS